MSDYVSKRQPIARGEIKAFIEGQQQLCEQLDMSNAATIRYAKRHAQRIMSDLYGRATVRMAVEALNLLIMRRKHDKTRAESLRSNLLAPFPCKQYIACQGASVGGTVNDVIYETIEIDRRNAQRPRVVSDKNVGYKYGYRGTHDAVRYLSPYEFVSEWEILRVTYPSQPQVRFSTAGFNEEANLHESPYHAKLTASGIEKIKGKAEDLVPGKFMLNYCNPDSDPNNDPKITCCYCNTDCTQT